MANRPYILVYMDPLLTYLLASVPSLTQPKDNEIKVYTISMFPTTYEIPKSLKVSPWLSQIYFFDLKVWVYIGNYIFQHQSFTVPS